MVCDNETVELIGVVEQFLPPNRLSGWVSVSNCRVNAVIDEMTAGDSIPDRDRPDLESAFGNGPHGFILQISTGLTTELLDQKRLRVFGTTKEGRIAHFSILPSVRAGAEAYELVERHANSSLHSVSKFIETVSRRQNLDSKVRYALQWASSIIDRNDAPSILAPADISNIGIASGISSGDNSVVIGKDGYIFLNEGSNALRAQYDEDPLNYQVSNIAERWLKLFSTRATTCQEKNIEYIQMIIPEKNSILMEKFDHSLRNETAISHAIRLKGNSFKELEGKLLPIADSIRNAGVSDKVFLKTDTHMNSFGSWFLSKEILSALHLDYDLRIDWASSTKRVRAGDISDRIFGVPLYEIYDEPACNELDRIASGVQRVSHYRPPNGAHIGGYSEWHSFHAPVKLRVLALANSFFEHGGGSLGLSWWCSKIFSNFRFVWSPDLIESEIENFKPDVLICQTVERFLPWVPNT